MDLAVLLAVPATIAAVLAATTRRTGRVAALGVVLALAGLGLAYLAAPTGGPPEGCSDCGLYAGRWWEPWLAASLLGLGYLAWLGGALVAAVALRARRPSRGRP